MYDWHFAHQCSSSLWTIYLIYRSTLAKTNIEYDKKKFYQSKVKIQYERNVYAWSIKQHIF